MANRWGNSGNSADGDCSPEIERRLLLGRKVMTNPDSILKNRDITLPTKVCLVKAMVFLVVMYECESWTIKKAEHQRKQLFLRDIPKSPGVGNGQGGLACCSPRGCKESDMTERLNWTESYSKRMLPDILLEAIVLCDPQSRELVT